MLPKAAKMANQKRTNILTAYAPYQGDDGEKNRNTETRINELQMSPLRM